MKVCIFGAGAVGGHLAAKLAATGHAVSVVSRERPSAATPHKPSMLQDYELGRPMEVEAILHAPLAFAAAAGVPAPTLSAVAALVSWRATRKGLFSP